MVTKPIEILLVEDNPGDIRLMRDYLQRSKVSTKVNVVENGAAALSFLKKQGKYADAATPQLIILDLNMPIKGGREVLSEVKEDPILKHIPIIVFTTSDAQMDINNSYKLHANCYITKPADLEQFYRVVTGIENFWLTMAKLPK